MALHRPHRRHINQLRAKIGETEPNSRPIATPDVESRAGAPTVGSGGNSVTFASGLSPAPMVTFPAPAPRTRRADFRHRALQWDHAPRTRIARASQARRRSGSPDMIRGCGTFSRTDLSATPTGPACPSRGSGSRVPRHRRGFSCCVHPPLPYVPPPIPRRNRPVLSSLASRPIAAFLNARTLFDGAVITAFDGRRSPTGTKGAGRRMGATGSRSRSLQLLRVRSGTSSGTPRVVRWRRWRSVASRRCAPQYR